MDSVSSYLPKAYWSILALGAIIFIVYCLMMYVLYKQVFKNEMLNVKYIIKITLIVLSVITFIFSVISMVLMVSTVMISSFCDFNQEILEQTEFSSFLAQFSIELEEKELSFLNECLPATAGGDVLKILNVPSSFDNLQTMLDGFSGFNNFKE